MNANELKSAAALLGRKGGASRSEAKQATSRENGRKGGRPAEHMTVFATPTPTGFTLTDQRGKEMQEGFEYPSREAALEAAALLWPANSTWKGKRVGDKWRIKVN